MHLVMFGIQDGRYKTGYESECTHSGNIHEGECAHSVHLQSKGQNGSAWDGGSLVIIDQRSNNVRKSFCGYHLFIILYAFVDFRNGGIFQVVGCFFFNGDY